MINKFIYKILKNKSLIFEHYCGKYNVNELIDLKTKVSNDNDYDPNFNVIHDFRELEFLLELDEISKYVNLISNNEKYYGNRKSAMITKTPNQVIASLGFELLKKELPIQVKVCSTIESAFTFVELPIKDWKETESLIIDLITQINITV